MSEPTTTIEGRNIMYLITYTEKYYIINFEGRTFEAAGGYRKQKDENQLQLTFS